MSDLDFFDEEEEDDYENEEEEQKICQQELDEIGMNSQQQNTEQKDPNVDIFQDFEDIAEQTEEKKRVALLQNIQKSKNPQREYQENQENNLTQIQDLLEKHKKEIEQEKQNNPHIISEEAILQRILDKKEMKKITNKLRQNPETYINFTKSYILIDLIRVAFIMKTIQNQDIQAQIISRLNPSDLNFLEDLFLNKNELENQKKNKKEFQGLISTLMYHFKKHFVYKWKQEQKNLEENLENPENYCFGYIQMLQIFIILCKYFKLQVKLSYIQDLSLLDIDQKYSLTTGANKITDFVKKNKKRQKKQVKSTSDLEFSEESDDYFEQEHKKTQKSKRAQGLSAFMERKIFNAGKQKLYPPPIKRSKNKSVLEEEDSDVNDDSGNETSKKQSDKKQEKKEKDDNLEDMLEQFKFVAKKNTKKSTNKTLTSINRNKSQQNQQQQPEKQQLQQQQDTPPTEKIQKTQEKENSDKLPKIANFDNIEDYAKNNNNKKKEQNYQQQENERLNLTKLSDHYKDDEIKLWIEIYDEKAEKWVSVDPISQKFLTETSIKNKLAGIPVLFVVSFQTLNLKKSNFKNEKRPISQEEIDQFLQNRPLNDIFLSDISGLYAENYLKLQISRRSLKLDLWWTKLKHSYLEYTGLKDYLPQPEQIAIQKEIQLIEAKIQQILPTSPYQFRVSDYYIIKSEVKKYKMLHPNAIPTAHIFKDEEVYLKKDVIELNGKTRWSRMQRKIKKGEKGLKQVASIMGGGRMVDLYAVWQTEFDEVKIGKDGSLPRNQYNNFDICNGILPEGVVYIDLPYLPKMLKKQNIEFVEAMTGFEKGKSGGMPHPKIFGVIAHQRDEKKIREIFEENIEEIEQKRIDSLRNGLMLHWRQLFKAILLKKQISEKYDKIHN